MLYPAEISVRRNSSQTLLSPPRHGSLMSRAQIEVSMLLTDWQVLATYPPTSLVPDAGRQRLRWFLKVKPGGAVVDVLTGTESSGLFVELL